jgi:RNA recognition motif-containing protein
VRIARNHNGQSKGFGYIEYKTTDGAYQAVQKAAKPFGLKVGGRPVFVDYDEGSVRGSFRGKDGKLWSKEFGDRGRKGKTGGRGHR